MKELLAEMEKDCRKAKWNLVRAALGLRNSTSAEHMGRN